MKTLCKKLIETGRGGKQELKCITTPSENDTYENIYYFCGIPFYKTITDDECVDELVVSKEVLNMEIFHRVFECILAQNIGLYDTPIQL